MGSVRVENEAGELSCHVNHKRGIRICSVSPRRRKITLKKCCKQCVLQYPSLVESGHEFTSSIPIHAVFIFLNPLMVDLLQVEYQSKKLSPFETHAANMWIFFVATCIHCLGLAFEMKIQNSGAHYCKIFSNFVLFAGALSSISLASVILPRLLGWICLSLWTILPFTVGFPMLVSAFRRLYSATREKMALLFKRFIEFVSCLSEKKLCLPK